MKGIKFQDEFDSNTLWTLRLAPEGDLFFRRKHDAAAKALLENDFIYTKPGA
jgi:hypothetical protein